MPWLWNKVGCKRVMRNRRHLKRVRERARHLRDILILFSKKPKKDDDRRKDDDWLKDDDRYNDDMHGQPDWGAMTSMASLSGAQPRNI